MGWKVLVTGANGFTGSNLLRVMDDSGWDVLPLVRRRSGLANEVCLDFCDHNLRHKLNQLPKVDAIVHLGAKIGWGGSSQNELLRPNVLATAELADWAKSTGAYFLFSSAAIVCGVGNTHIISDSEPNPDTDYGYSKWLAEEIIKMSGAKRGILRIAGIFGRNGPQHLGINVAIERALEGKLPIQRGTGEINRNYIYVKDLCHIIKFCIESELEGTHLVSGGSVNTVSEMLKIICEVFLDGKGPESIEHKGVAKDQIIEHSEHLPSGRSFVEAIKDIKSATEASL